MFLFYIFQSQLKTLPIQINVQLYAIRIYIEFLTDKRHYLFRKYCFPFPIVISTTHNRYVHYLEKQNKQKITDTIFLLI